jgi:hypothetical protein
MELPLCRPPAGDDDELFVVVDVDGVPEPLLPAPSEHVPSSHGRKIVRLRIVVSVIFRLQYYE